MKKWLLWCLAGVGLPLMAAPWDDGRCVVPAKKGGGFDLTCLVVREALVLAGITPVPLPLVYRPGGIGALAFGHTVTREPAHAGQLVAFSSGSLLNLAQGRFGPHTLGDVRWVATLAKDYGVVAVRHDSPYKTLPQLMAALKEAPGRMVFGAGGSIGSQDWMKAALLARASGVSHKNMRFVAFEGGGEALSALRSDHVQVVTGDAAEVRRQIEQGAKVRLLAVLADQRLPGPWAQVPTAIEQGFNLQWPIYRGVYLGPRVSDRDHREWVAALTRAMAHPAAQRALTAAGLYPGFASGAALEELLSTQTAVYGQLAAEFGLKRRESKLLSNP